MKINILDEAVYSKIAAGEIIDKPASIVRELVDNSIDAHATKIDIRLKNGGINQITITDDGDGMSKDDLEKIFRLRRMVDLLDDREATELVLDRLKKSKSNKEFLENLHKAA